jgi:excisionase family DNA binding protein
MTGNGSADLSLREAADLLGVHYMTAYRYVRTGRLPARKMGGEWRIRRRDVEHLLEPSTRRAAPGITATRRRLMQRLLAGDEAGSWTLVEEAMVGGLELVDVHLLLLAPALRAIGDGWEAGTVSVDEEHRAAAVSHRLVGRLGPRFARPGRNRGTVVLAGAPGDHHALPVAIAADVVRAARFSVVDLGADVPPESLSRAARAADRVVAVGICVSVSGNTTAVRAAVSAARRAVPGAVVLLGGSAIDEAASALLGADGYAPDAAGLVVLLDGVTQ